MKNKIRKEENLKKYKSRIKRNPDIKRLDKLIKISNSQPKTSHKHNLSDFNKKNKELKKSQKEFYVENENFIQAYSSLQKLFPRKIEENFVDLISEYKQRGYKIPDLSIKRNLFTPNPLLLDNNRVIDYYSYYKKKKKIPLIFAGQKDKHLVFLKNEENLVELELFKIKQKKKLSEKRYKEETTELNILTTSNLTLQTEHSRNSRSILSKEIRKTIRKQLKKENEEIKSYNESIKDLLLKTKVKSYSISYQKNKKCFSPLKHQYTLAPSIETIDNKLVSRRTSLPLFYQNKNFIKKKSPVISTDKLIDDLNNTEYQNNFLDKLEHVKLTKLSRESLNYIVKIYCKKFLKFQDNKIDKLLKPHFSDNEVIHLIKDFIQKSQRTNIIRRDFPVDSKLISEEINVDDKSKKLEYKFADYNAHKIFT